MNPFTKQPKKQLRHFGECDLLKHIRSWTKTISPPSPYGIGDDCAVFETNSNAKNLASVDALVYGRHFDATCTAKEAGAKLVKRNLSDIAAMGGRPTVALIALTLSPNVDFSWLEHFYSGVTEEAERYQVQLVGGDISCAREEIFVAQWTQLGYANRPLTRQGGQIDDLICATGELGGSALGAHKTFRPKLSEGQWLASRPEVRSMIDITDGLAKEIPELLPEGCHGLIKLEKLPISKAAKTLSSRNRQLAIKHALCDGEDYELLFTLDASASKQEFLLAWAKNFETKLSFIGTIQGANSKSAGKLLDDSSREMLEFKGFDSLLD